MANGRSRQLRIERKRRRRERRRGGGIRAKKESTPELKHLVRLIVPAPGQVAPSGLLDEVPSILMSDALVELMDPYIFWPPTPDEVEDLECWLELGANVWNATVEANNDAALTLALARLAADLDVEDALGIVHEVARRKLARFATDRRRVATVRVVEKDGWSTVEATSFEYVSTRGR